MKLVIFTLGLVFLTVGQAYQPSIDVKLINEINAVVGEAKSLLVEVITLIQQGLPTRAQVLELVERNALVIKTKEILLANKGSKVTKVCKALLKKNLIALVNEVIVIANKDLTGELITIEKELRNIIAELEILKGKVEYVTLKVLKITKRVNQLAQTVSNLKVTVAALLTLGKIESKVIPGLAQVKILEPVTLCLKQHSYY